MVDQLIVTDNGQLFVVYRLYIPTISCWVKNILFGLFMSCLYTTNRCLNHVCFSHWKKSYPFLLLRMKKIHIIMSCLKQGFCQREMSIPGIFQNYHPQMLSQHVHSTYIHTLEMSAIKVDLKGLNILPSLLVSSITLRRSFPRTSTKLLKNRMGHGNGLLIVTNSG